MSASFIIIEIRHLFRVMKSFYTCQTELAVFCVGKWVGENNGSTIDFIVFEKVARGRSSREIAKNADWYTWGGGGSHL